VILRLHLGCWRCRNAGCRRRIYARAKGVAQGVYSYESLKAGAGPLFLAGGLGGLEFRVESKTFLETQRLDDQGWVSIHPRHAWSHYARVPLSALVSVSCDAICPVDEIGHTPRRGNQVSRKRERRPLIHDWIDCRFMPSVCANSLWRPPYFNTRLRVRR
jgi:hypothetical protein